MQIVVASTVSGCFSQIATEFLIAFTSPYSQNADSVSVNFSGIVPPCVLAAICPEGKCSHKAGLITASSETSPNTSHKLHSSDRKSFAGSFTQGVMVT